MRKLGVAAAILAALAALAALPAGAKPTGGDPGGLLPPGTYTTTQFQPTLTYTVPAGWNNYCESPGDVCFAPPGTTVNGSQNGGDYVDVFTSVANSAGRGCPKTPPGPIHTPAAFVRWLQHLRNLTVSRPAAVTIGGLSGYMVDVRLSKYWTRKHWTEVCPGFPTYVETVTGRPPSPGDLSLGVGPRPQVQKMYLLSYNGGTLSVQLFARKGGAKLASYSSVVDTFQFAP